MDIIKKKLHAVNLDKGPSSLKTLELEDAVGSAILVLFFEPRLNRSEADEMMSFVASLPILMIQKVARFLLVPNMGTQH